MVGSNRSVLFICAFCVMLYVSGRWGIFYETNHMVVGGEGDCVEHAHKVIGIMMLLLLLLLLSRVFQ